MPILTRCCPVCGRDGTEILFSPRESPGPISKCINCGMVYVAVVEDPHALILNGPVIYDGINQSTLTSSNLDEVKDSWELRDIKDKEAEVSCLRLNALDSLKRITTYVGQLKPNMRLLDYGSGFGFFLSVAKEQGWSAYGIEPLPATSTYARSKFDLTIITDILREDTFEKDYFDVVASFQVFEHIPNPNETMGILSKLLKRGGVILVEVPRFDTWTMRLMRSKHRHFVQDHINFFTIDTLSLLFRNNDIQILESYSPKRIMSMEHLFNCWIVPRLPKTISRIIDTFLHFSGLWNRNLGMNIGDMLTVVGQKL